MTQYLGLPSSYGGILILGLGSASLLLVLFLDLLLLHSFPLIGLAAAGGVVSTLIWSAL